MVVSSATRDWIVMAFWCAQGVSRSQGPSTHMLTAHTQVDTHTYIRAHTIPYPNHATQTRYKPTQCHEGSCFYTYREHHLKRGDCRLDGFVTVRQYGGDAYDWGHHGITSQRFSLVKWSGDAVPLEAVQFTYVYEKHPSRGSYYIDPDLTVLNDGDVPSKITRTNFVDWSGEGSWGDHDPLLDLGEVRFVRKVRVSYIVVHAYSKTAPRHITLRAGLTPNDLKNGYNQPCGYDFIAENDPVRNADGGHTIEIPTLCWDKPVRYIELSHLVVDRGAAISEIAVEALPRSLPVPWTKYAPVSTTSKLLAYQESPPGAVPPDQWLAPIYVAPLSAGTPLGNMSGQVYFLASPSAYQLEGLNVSLSGALGIQRATLTAADGSFRFSLLPPGMYQLRVTSVQSGLHLAENSFGVLYNDPEAALGVVIVADTALRAVLRWDPRTTIAPSLDLMAVFAGGTRMPPARCDGARLCDSNRMSTCP